mmetsp:Transcript_32340/g.100066  ORF Transcript_32340/g.100066 Transcript_32340/m.100066 type:complete len:88 (+) Transcript_32340:575-838(+)
MLVLSRIVNSIRPDSDDCYVSLKEMLYRYRGNATRCIANRQERPANRNTSDTWKNMIAANWIKDAPYTSPLCPVYDTSMPSTSRIID